MEIDIIDLIEREDGSATIVVEMSEEVKCKILSVGVKTLLQQYLASNEEE